MPQVVERRSKRYKEAAKKAGEDYDAAVVAADEAQDDGDDTGLWGLTGLLGLLGLAGLKRRKDTDHRVAAAGPATGTVPPRV